MSISLKKFVDINIKSHVKSVVERTRPTIVLFTGDSRTYSESQTYDEYSSLAEVTQFANTTDTYKYLSIYFANGGQKVRVYANQTLTIALNSETGIYEFTGKSDLLTAIKALPNELICIGFVIPGTETNAYVATKDLMIALNTQTEGINEKIFIVRTSSKLEESSKVKNLAVKYSTILGAEASIGAYLSKTDIDKANSVEDYAFTQEYGIVPEDITDAEYDMIVTTNNNNVDINLSGTIRNIGGNCKDGNDVINSYVRIILHQTLTERLIDLLTQKLKISTGIGKVYNALIGELERYRSAGYLINSKMWSDEDWTELVNGVNYTIITKGEALPNGYYIKILPTYSLSQEDIALRKFPNIYIVIADQYGIRKITIDGEII